MKGTVIVSEQKAEQLGINSDYAEERNQLATAVLASIRLRDQPESLV